MGESKNLWHVIGGNIDEVKVDEEPAFTAIKKEILEEINVHESEITSLVCTGLGVNLKIKKPEFLFIAKVSINAKELGKRFAKAQDNFEHDFIKLIPRQEIKKFIKKNDFAVIGKAAIYQYIKYWE